MKKVVTAYDLILPREDVPMNLREGGIYYAKILYDLSVVRNNRPIKLMKLVRNSPHSNVSDNGREEIAEISIIARAVTGTLGERTALLEYRVDKITHLERVLTYRKIDMDGGDK